VTERLTPSAPPPADVAPVAELSLAAEFATPTHAAWEALVAGVLTKARRLPEDSDPGRASDVLRSATDDGFALEPLYARGTSPGASGYPGVAPFTRGRTATGRVPYGWDRRQLHADPDPAASRAAVLADLEGGVSSLWLRLGPGAIAVTDLPEVLADVDLALAPVVLDAGDDVVQAAQALLDLAAARGSVVTGALGADPVAQLARTGTPGDIDAAVALARRCAAAHPDLRAFVIDALPYHEAGGSDVDELAASLSAGVAALRAMVAGGLDLVAALDQLEFRYAVTADELMGIAKLRAGRRLWARVAEASGAPTASGGQRQHAVTSWAMTTRRDPWVNMLRTTLAGFAAGVGGADAVTTLPFDAALGQPDPFSRRIARNVQALLVEESHLGRVLDPAGGSWAVESMTDELATAAWAAFQQLEAAGGLPAALPSGALARRLRATAAQRLRRIATRAEAITGVSEFPQLVEVLDRPPTLPTVVDQPPAPGLPRHRYAEPYEVLRDRADAAPERPTVLLCQLGTRAEAAARVGFATNLLAAGGISVQVADGELDEALRSSGLRVAVLAGADAAYLAQAVQAAQTLTAAGATRVVLAGRPPRGDTSYAEAGIVDTFFAGCDALALLERTLAALEVT